MGKQMHKNRVRAGAVKNMPVVVHILLYVKYVAKQFLAKGFQQIILGLKVSIEGGSSNVCLFNDLPHSDLMKALLGEQTGKGMKNSLPCFSLPPIHTYLHTIFEFCSVTNTTTISYVAIWSQNGIIITEHIVLY
jgi:hypothetical protein